MASAGKILNHMIELKGLSEDVMKNDSDSENYNREFKDLQMQIHDMATLKFNGVSMFAQFSSETAGTEGKFGDLNLDNTVSVVSADGTAGAKVSVNKALLLSALTIDAGTLAASEFSNAGTKHKSLRRSQRGSNNRFVGHIGWCVHAGNRKHCDLRVPTTVRRCRSCDSPAKRWPSKRQTWWPPWVGSRAWTSPPSTRMAKYKRLGSSLGRHAVTGELEHRRRTHAPEVTHRMSKKPHHFKNRGSRPPQPKLDGTADKEVRGIYQTKSRRITPCHLL